MTGLAHNLALLNPASITLAAGDSPISPLAHVNPWYLIGNGSFGLSIQMLALLLAAGLTILFLFAASKSIATGPESLGNKRYVTKGRLSQIIEVVTLYMRDNVVKPQLGEQTNKFLPFLLTTFFFIWCCNLLGLVPLIDFSYLVGKALAGMGMIEYYTDAKIVGGTATGTLAMTAALATVAFIYWNIAGIKALGLGSWLHHFTGGTPIALWPIMIPVEIIGLFVKPIALTIRLMANMTAGHILLAVLIGFTGLSATLLTQAMGNTGTLLSMPIWLISLFGGTAIFFLEIFVATLQAFIFMFLTTVFIGQLVTHHHDDHGHDEDHSTHAHAEPAAA